MRPYSRLFRSTLDSFVLLHERYWRSRVADTYGERETRVRSLLAFAAAEIDALAGELGSRGPAQLDEERHVSERCAVLCNILKGNVRVGSLCLLFVLHSTDFCNILNLEIDTIFHWISRASFFFFSLAASPRSEPPSACRSSK